MFNVVTSILSILYLGVSPADGNSFALKQDFQIYVDELSTFGLCTSIDSNNNSLSGCPFYAQSNIILNFNIMSNSADDYIINLNSISIQHEIYYQPYPSSYLDYTYLGTYTDTHTFSLITFGSIDNLVNYFTNEGVIEVMTIDDGDATLLETNFYLNERVSYQYTLSVDTDYIYHPYSIVNTQHSFERGDVINSFNANMLSIYPPTSSYDLGYQTGYAVGEANGYSSGYDAGYSEGNTNGYVDGSSAGYTSGYDDGYDDGYLEGDHHGYDVGYDDGYEDGAEQDEVATSIFTGIINIALVPINFFLACLNFEVFGINIGAFVSALLTIAIVVIIIRIVINGGNKND